MSILIIGENGFLGKAVGEKLDISGFEYFKSSHFKNFDLRYKELSEGLFNEIRPTVVINCAAVVGGISWKEIDKSQILTDNLRMVLVIHEMMEKYDFHLISPISNCVYPNNLMPFKESQIWDGPLEKTVLAYAGARRTQLLLSDLLVSERRGRISNLVFPNLFGPGDHLDPLRAHALGALVSKFVKAIKTKSKSVTILGSGNPIREWMFVKDAADIILKLSGGSPLMKTMNFGSGIHLSISDLAVMISQKMDYKGKLIFDTSYPDGAPFKVMDSAESRLFLQNFQYSDFDQSLEETIIYYQKSL